MPSLDPQPRSIQSIYGWYKDGKLFVNRRYQRKLVWTLIEKQKLIESITSEFPVPAILLAERPDGGFEIIDGLQRLFSIMSFIENAYPMIDGRYFDIAQFPTAKLRSDEGIFDAQHDGPLMTAKDVGTFLDYSIAITVMRGASEREIDDVFARINTYGHRLSDQERRQAGVQTAFTEAVRELACELRGDVSSDVLLLEQMPSISIDSPSSNHGYDVQASEVFWVIQGVLTSFDLRDSADEQCIADIMASIVGGELIERSRSAMDAIYDRDSLENRQIASATEVYGPAKFAAEFKYCVEEIQKICNDGTPTKLRTLLFQNASTNSFPSVFAVLLIALHEALIQNMQVISDYAGVKAALTGLTNRLDTTRGSTSVAKRRSNIDVTKGIIARFLAPGELGTIYGTNAVTDIDAAIRQQAIELAHFELKQGLVSLSETDRQLDETMLPKIIRTICAIANNGRDRTGTILIGVADKESDARRIQELDQITPRKVGRRYVVGIRRESDFLQETTETYYTRIKNGIRNSGLSDPLKNDVLASIDYNDYFGLGVIVIPVPRQTAPSTVDDRMYARAGDETVEATLATDIVGITQRFS